MLSEFCVLGEFCVTSALPALASALEPLEMMRDSNLSPTARAGEHCRQRVARRVASHRSLLRMCIIMLVPLPSALLQWGGRASPACRQSRHRPPALLCDGQQPHLTIEEYEALSGVWRTELELDDGDATISLHLATPKSLGNGSPGGKVHATCPQP